MTRTPPSTPPKATRRSSRRRKWILAAAATLPFAMLLALAGCATTVVLPEVRRDPVKAYLVDYGRHASLLLPQSEDVLVEFAFGEWKWFALDQTGFWAAWRAMCWSSEGTLGRRETSAAGIDRLRQPSIGIEVIDLPVEREMADALLERLETRWNQNSETAVYNADYGMHFVRDRRNYHLFQNCNPAVAEWLEELGCTVSGMALLSSWSVQPAQ